MGELVAQGKSVPVEDDDTATPIAEAVTMFLNHVRVHSPDKPKTIQRYSKVLEHFERILGGKKFIEAITRADIDDYKATRSGETSQQHKDRPITPRTINYEVSVVRTFFYFLINERGLRIENPAARFKALKDQNQKANRRPPTYKQAELDRLLGACTELDRTVFATFLLTGLREQELYFLAWPDVDLRNPESSTLCVTGRGKEGFSPKDYEEREIPIPRDLARLLKKLPRRSEWVFANGAGRQLNHLLRRLKEVADGVGVANATLHKFRHTYATRLLEAGCDIVTVQKLMGHSDIETTRQYLNPDEDLKRQAVSRLRLDL